MWLALPRCIYFHFHRQQSEDVVLKSQLAVLHYLLVRSFQTRQAALAVLRTSPEQVSPQSFICVDVCGCTFMPVCACVCLCLS